MKEEQADKDKCDIAYTKVLRYLKLIIVDGEIYHHPSNDEGASDDAAEAH